MGKKEKVRKFHRAEILQATYRLCEYNNVSKVTMREISKESEYTLVTIYKYFGNKEELFFELITALMEEKSHWIFPMMDDFESSLEKIFAYTYGNFIYLQKFPTELKVVNFIQSAEFNRQNTSDEIIQQHDQRRLVLYHFFEAMFKKGIEDGTFRKDLDILITQDLMTATYRQVLYLEICLNDRPQNYFWEYSKIFLRAIVTEQKQAKLQELLNEKIVLPPLPDKIQFKHIYE